MIYITQGHPQGIGLEVFLKSFFLFNKKQRKKMKLLCEEKVLRENCKALGIPPESLASSVIPILSKNPTLTALERSLEVIKEEDALLTLPASKDSFDGFKGHTDFFRSRYPNNKIGMTFKSKNLSLFLVTDHIPLDAVASQITGDNIREKCLFLEDALAKDFPEIQELIFLGLNPHSGENGQLGNQELQLTPILKSLESKSRYRYSYFHASDSFLLSRKLTSESLLISFYHDQGLSLFKTYSRFQGFQITMGLPFCRVSPDHGTGFDIYGKGKANLWSCYNSMRYLLNKHP